MAERHDFEERLKRVEDQLEILNLLAGLAFSSDVASEAYQCSCYAENVQMDRGPGQIEQGQEAVVGLIRRPGHLAAIKEGMAHFAGQPRVDISGDTAVAIGYLQIVIPDRTRTEVEMAGHGVSGTLLIWRLSVNRWDLVRTDRGWRVAKRTIRAMADEEALALVRDGIEAVG